MEAAEGLRALPDSAEAMGMVGGRIANLSDPSVVRTNPASLTRLEGTTFQFNFQSWYGDTDFTRLDGAQDSMIVPWKFTGSLYMTHQLSDKATVGLGISAPYGISINWPRQGLFRYVAPYDTVLQTMALNPALGIKLSDRVSLGLGLDIYYSKLKMDQAYRWAGVVPGSPDGDMTFKGTGTGVGAFMGLNFDIGDNQRLSVTGRLPVTVKYDGYFDISNVPGAVSGVFSQRSEFNSEIEHPGSVGVGYGVDINERLTMGLDFEWTQNSTHDDLPLDIGTNQALLGGVTTLPMNWKDSISAGTGLSYKASDRLTLRAGYLYSESPMNNRTFSPSVPANDRHIFSVGAGCKISEDTTVDFAYSYIAMEESAVRGNQTPAFNGNYKYEWSIFTLSCTKRF